MCAPTTSGGTTFGPGTANNLLRSNGTSVYWSALSASDIPTISIIDKTSGTLTVERGGTGQTSIANIQAGKDGDGNTISSTYLKLSGGDLTGDLGIITRDTDKFINFWYSTNKIAGASWRLGVLGSGSSDTNYFVIQSGTSTTSATTWNNAIRIGQNTYDTAVGGNLYPLTNNTKTLGTSSYKWSNVYATTFTGNLTGDVSGTASNVTGTVAIDHGGTGATTAAAARVNLGLGTTTNNYHINANANGSSETLSMVYTVENSKNIALNGHELLFLIRYGGLQLLDKTMSYATCWTLETRQGRASVTAGNGSVETTHVSFGEGKSFPTASYYVVASVYSNVLARIRDVRIGTDNYATDGFDITAVSTSGSELTGVPVNWIAILQ